MVGVDDIYIDSIFNGVRADYDGGFSELEEMNGMIAACRGDLGTGCPVNPNIGPNYTLQQCIADCSACSTAIVAEVYR